jgi:hypothetical protein
MRRCERRGAARSGELLRSARDDDGKPSVTAPTRVSRRPHAPYPIGTPTRDLDVRMVSEDFTLATFGAEVSLVVNNR